MCGSEWRRPDKIVRKECDCVARPELIWGRFADGLIADHVTDVAAYRDGLALATPAGLTFLDAGGASSMYAFNGIVNNHIYALGVSGDQLLAGSNLYHSTPKRCERANEVLGCCWRR